MRTLYIECNMGAAGDMLMASLLELHSDADAFVEKLNHIGIPGVHIEKETAVKCGISGTHMKVTVDGIEEESHDHHHHEHTHEGGHTHSHGEIAAGHEHKHAHEHTHEDGHTHSHEHTHPHVHRGMQEILQIVDGLAIPETVKEDVKQIYQLVAEAESRVHGKIVSEIHFHEVGMMDAIADITGCALLMHELQVEKVIVSPVNTGYGQVRCAHGILPVPAPATALLLNGIPTYAGSVEGELCTPTGAAILKYYAKEFGRQPQMTVERIGYGMGKKDFTQANLIRTMLGETAGTEKQISELCCNLDDMTAEEIGYAMEKLMDQGALDVYTTAIGMKKNRPGTLLTVMCRLEDRDKMAKLLFLHTTTIGIRETLHNRMTLQRKEYVKETALGPVRFKESAGYGVNRIKPEFEDLKKLAEEKNCSLMDIKRCIID